MPAAEQKESGGLQSIAAAIAQKALEKKPAAEDGEEKYAALGSELLAALEKKDGKGLGKLLREQVRIAVADAMRDGRGK